MKKFIYTFLIIGLVTSSLFFVIPTKKAQALDGGSGWVNAIKNTVLDAVGTAVTDMVLNNLTDKIQAWGMGETSDANTPLAVIDWTAFFKKAINEGSARFISEAKDIFENSDDKFTRDVGKTLEAVGLFTNSSDLDQYKNYAKPTLKDDLGEDKYARFLESSMSIVEGGWESWFSMMKPQNNIFGQITMAERAREEYERNAKEAADKEAITGGGYPNEKVNTLTSTDKCKSRCKETYIEGVDEITDKTTENLMKCINNCDKEPSISIAQKVKNLGTQINTSMKDAMSKDMQRIINVDEITELIGVFFSAVLNKAINGAGLMFASMTATEDDRDRAEGLDLYSYNRDFKQEQSLADRTDIKATILTNILKATQQFSRSIISCKEKEMMKEADYEKNLASIFNAEVEALYVGLEGINLKPDFEVLDSIIAPFPVYGNSWSQVPPNKFPSKCREITDQLDLGFDATCQDIVSGLEPTYIDPLCSQCMNDDNALNCPPEPYPPVKSVKEFTDDIIKAKQAFYNACRSPYLNVLNRCDDCIKNADSKCGQLDLEQKNACIANACNNYGDIPSVRDGLDFHNRCLLEEKKESCNVCLKEYFMPATYCEETQDYFARAITKYPTLIRETHANDEGLFIGPKDDLIMDLGGACKNNWTPVCKSGERNEVCPRLYNLSLICRIMPDFKYGDEKVCETRCNKRGMTPEQLRNITDFRPNEADCGGEKLNIGGNEPFKFIQGGALLTKNKCCATLNAFDEENYTACIGSAEVAKIKPPSNTVITCENPATNPEQCCAEGYRPLTPYINTGKHEPFYYSQSTSFVSPQDEVYACSELQPGGAMWYIASGKSTQTGICSQKLKSPFKEAGPRVIPIVGSQVACSDNCDLSLTCQELQNDQSCDIKEVSEGDKNPCGGPPSGVICKKETARGKQEGRIPSAEERTMKCDLSNVTGSVKFSIYHDELGDVAEYRGVEKGMKGDTRTGGQICVKCNPSDADYPLYGTKVDQCNSKITTNPCPRAPNVPKSNVPGAGGF